MKSIWQCLIKQSIVICLIIMGGFSTSIWCQEESTEEIGDATPSFLLGSMDLSGTFHTSYWFQSFDGRTDNDIYSYLSLKFDDIIKDRLDGAFSMRWWEDFNGGSSLEIGENYDPFFDLDDADDQRFKFFKAYLDFKDLIFDDSHLIVGRQFLDEIDYSHFDGGTYIFEPIDRLEVTLFGGRPVSFYSSNDGDAFYGTNLEYRFTPQTKGAVRYYRYDSDPFEDDLAAIEVWHLFTANLNTHLEFSLLDADPYMLQNDWYYTIDGLDLDITAQLLHLFEDIGNHTINFNPYFPLLNSYEPFTYGSLFATKGMGEFWSIVAGFDLRLLDSGNDPMVDFTNRDYRRFSAGVEVYPVDKLTVSVMGEFWDVNPSDEFTGITGEVEYDMNQQWTFSAGVDYGEYVQEFRDEWLLLFGDASVFRITPDVITYYARARYRPTSNSFAQARFEVEDNSMDDDEWYSARLELGVNF